MALVFHSQVREPQTFVCSMCYVCSTHCLTDLHLQPWVFSFPANSAVLLWNCGGTRWEAACRILRLLTTTQSPVTEAKHSSPQAPELSSCHPSLFLHPALSSSAVPAAGIPQCTSASSCTRCTPWGHVSCFLTRAGSLGRTICHCWIVTSHVFRANWGQTAKLELFLWVNPQQPFVSAQHWAKARKLMMKEWPLIKRNSIKETARIHSWEINWIHWCTFTGLN